MPSLIKNEKEHLDYLSLYDRKELEYVLEEENKLRAKENLPLLTMDDLEKRDVIVSKKDNEVNGYSIVNLKFDENKDVNVLIERLHENNADDLFLHNELFEAAMFVAVEKVQLIKNNNNEIPKIISSTLMIEKHEVRFNITEEYIKRNLGDKFDKNAVRQKIELDEKYKKERKEIEDKVNANTFYNETGHRFHSNVDVETDQLSVVSNDYDNLSLKERLISLQQENLGSNKNLNELYQEFQKEKITTNLEDPDVMNLDDIKELKEEEKDLITAASMIDQTDDFKVDVSNGFAFDKNNKRIDLNEKKWESQKLGNNIELMASRGFSKEEIENVLRKDNTEWNKLSLEDKERIFELYGVTDNNIAKNNIEERNIDDIKHSKDLDPQVKKLVLKNDQAAYVSYVLISFISGLSAGIFMTLVFMFLRK